MSELFLLKQFQRLSSFFRGIHHGQMARSWQLGQMRRGPQGFYFAGTINWDLAMMETHKIGYDGVMMFEVANSGDPVDVLKRCTKARERLEKTFVTF